MPVSIWMAQQSEPGMCNKQYTATRNANPPAPVAPTALTDQLFGADTGLVYDTSKYGDWEIVGTADADLITDRYGEIALRLKSGDGCGMVVSPDDAVSFGWITTNA
ncbi:hypothetical protein LMG33810_002846 [Carnimonas sp. LMG 33810]